MSVDVLSMFCRCYACDLSMRCRRDEHRHGGIRRYPVVDVWRTHELVVSPSCSYVGGVVGTSYVETSPTSVLLRACVGGNVVDVLVGGAPRGDALTSGHVTRRIDSLDQPSRPTTSVESRSRTPSSTSFVSVVQAGAGDDLRGRGRYVFIGSRLVVNRHFLSFSVPPRSSAPGGRYAQSGRRGASECLSRAAGVAA